MQKRIIYLLIFILIALLATAIIVWYSKKIENLSISEIQTPKIQIPKTQKYSFEKIIYNFWGFVKAKEGDTLSVEGSSPERGDMLINPSLQTIKFTIATSTKIVRSEIIDKKTKQIFTDFAAIQIGDQVGLKTDKIDTIKKEATATDIVILPPPPAAP